MGVENILFVWKKLERIHYLEKTESSVDTRFTIYDNTLNLSRYDFMLLRSNDTIVKNDVNKIKCKSITSLQ